MINGGNIPGRKWYDGFMARHPSLKDARLQALDPKRARAFNRATVDDHFTKLATFLKENDIPPEHIWNMDEKGLQLNGGRKGNHTKYLIDCNSVSPYKSQSDDIRMVTVIECISTEGNCINPTFIFKGARVQKRWFPQNNEGGNDTDEALDTSGLSDDENDARTQHSVSVRCRVQLH